VTGTMWILGCTYMYVVHIMYITYRIYCLNTTQRIAPTLRRLWSGCSVLSGPSRELRTRLFFPCLQPLYWPCMHGTVTNNSRVEDTILHLRRTWRTNLTRDGCWFILYDMQHNLLILKHASSTANTFIHYGGIGAPIIFGRCPSLSAHENQSMLRTYLVC
jgi:hypothetical protein